MLLKKETVLDHHIVANEKLVGLFLLDNVEHVTLPPPLLMYHFMNLGQ